MNPNSHNDQSDTGASRPIHFISARLLGVQTPSLGIAICEPCKTTDNLMTNNGRVSTTTPPTILDRPQQAA